MNYFVGSWSCKTTKSPQPKNLGRISTQDVASHGPYLAVNYGKFGVARVTYNPRLKQFVYIETDNDGSYGASTSPGWSNGKSTWTSILSSDGNLTDIVSITQKGPSTYIFDVAKAGALDKPLSEQVCNKV